MKNKSDDWLRLATSAVDARDGLRRALAELQGIVQQTENPETRSRVARVLRTVAAEVDRLRHALKDRRASCRKAA